MSCDPNIEVRNGIEANPYSLTHLEQRDGPNWGPTARGGEFKPLLAVQVLVLASSCLQAV
jgi:hypothetical protein